MKKLLWILLIIIVSQKAMTQQSNINKENSNIPTIVKLDQEHLKLQKETTAQKEFQQISKSKKNQKKANELLQQGREFWNKGELKKAIEKVTEAQNLMPKDQKIMKTLKAMQKQKQMIDDALTKSNQLILQKKFKEAQRTLRKAERISKKYPLYIETINKLVIEKKKVDEIKKSMAEAEKAEDARSKAAKQAKKRQLARDEAQRELEAKRRFETEVATISVNSPGSSFNTHKEYTRSQSTSRGIQSRSSINSQIKYIDTGTVKRPERKPDGMILEPKVTIDSTSTSDEKHNQVFYEKGNHTIVDILYGTDRKIDHKEDWENYYTGERGELKYGVAQVSIPKKHKFGEIERPSKYLFWQKEKIGEHVIISSLEDFQKKDFTKFLRNKLNNVTEKDILIFIHGFNVTFASAIRRTAQISYDLQFKGVPMAYSWPSRGKVKEYARDEESIKYTKPNLVAFLKNVIENKENANIHIIGHSMGTRALTNALIDISQAYPGKHVFKNIILAAPDIDRDIFLKNLYPHIIKTTDKITLYASSDDKALQASNAFHFGVRMGEGGNDVFVYEGLDTIDASGIDTSLLGHSYFAEKEILVTDLKEVITKSLPPTQRKSLIEKIKEKLAYWKFKLGNL